MPVSCALKLLADQDTVGAIYGEEGDTFFDVSTAAIHTALEFVQTTSSM